ncbi:MAG: geranylgeranyl reductase, partial [Candidatus Bipolaricaulia bacterium]
VSHVEGVEGLGDHGEIYVQPPDYAILSPVGAGRVNLSLVVPLEHARPHRANLETFFLGRLTGLIHLRPRLLGMRLVSPVKAVGPLAYRVAQPRLGGVLLVGDAAGFYDPFTGEGIFMALRSAELAAEVGHEALMAGDCSVQALARFGKMRHEAFGDKETVNRLLQAVIGRRWLANLVAHQLAQRPGLMNLLMGVIGDFVPPRELPSSRVLFALGRG